MGNDKSFDSSKALLAEIRKEPRSQAIIEQCLAEGADINYQDEGDGYTALMLAVDKDDEPLVAYLLQQGANPLIKNHHQEIASALALTHSPIYQLIKNYELLFATLNNDMFTVKAALAAGANINFQGQGGYTPILVAAENNFLELVEFFMVNGADLSLRCNDGRGVYFLSTDTLINRTLDYGKPFTTEQKKKLLEIESEDDENRFEKGRLKTLAARKGRPFALSQLQFNSIEKPASNEEIQELQDYIGHPLPEIYKEICRNFNGGRPKLNYYADSDLATIGFFITVTSRKNTINSVWSEIEHNVASLGFDPDILPIAYDSFNQSFFYLKWVNGKAQVWRFLYGDMAIEFREEDEENYEKHGYVHIFINESLEGFLESLYAIED